MTSRKWGVWRNLDGQWVFVKGYVRRSSALRGLNRVQKRFPKITYTIGRKDGHNVQSDVTGYDSGRSR